MIHIHNLQIFTKGMIPIAKNINVVDEQGNEYEATYPKRAQGLVKNGRARFIDENKICLACPPKKILEDKIMNETNKNIIAVDQTTTGGGLSDLTIQYVLSRLDQVMEDTKHIHEALDAIHHMQVNEGMNNHDGDKARGDAISHAVQSREATNQQILRFLEKMYDDLKPQKPKTEYDDKVMQALIEAISDLPPPQKQDFLLEKFKGIL